MLTLPAHYTMMNADLGQGLHRQHFRPLWSEADIGPDYEDTV